MASIVEQSSPHALSPAPRKDVLALWLGILFSAAFTGLIWIIGRGDRNIAPYQSAYGSSKAWICAFTKTLVKENAKTGIDILAFNPGLMETALLQKVEVVRGYERKLKGFGTIIRMWANPPTVPAEKIVWLASSATNGKSGMEVNLLGTQHIVTEAFNELRGRLTRRPMPDKSPHIQVIDAWKGYL